MKLLLQNGVLYKTSDYRCKIDSSMRKNGRNITRKSMFYISACHHVMIIKSLVWDFLNLLLGNNPIQNHVDLKTTNVSLYLL